MNIWNKVFLGIIVVTAIAVVVLASVEQKIRTTGQKTINSLTKQIEETDDKITKIVTGTAPTKPSVDKSPSEWSFDELRRATLERFKERGRAWFGCHVRRDGVNPNTLRPALSQVKAQVIITSPFELNETGTETKVVRPDQLRGMVYVFDEGGENGAGSFLGRFVVTSDAPTPTKFNDDKGTEKDGHQVELISADPINDKEIDHILSSADKPQTRWAIYMTPPVDRVAGIFDQLTDEEKAAIPEEIREKFQPRPMPELTEKEKEGVDSVVVEMWSKIRATIDDPESESARDFATAFDWLYEQRSDLKRRAEIVQSDIATFEAALEKANAENDAITKDCVLEEKRSAAMEIQRDHVKTLKEQYEAEINKIALQIEKLQELITAYAAKIAEYQLKAVEKIEGQANSLARRNGE